MSRLYLLLCFCIALWYPSTTVSYTHLYGSFRELIGIHGFEPTFEGDSLVGLYLPYDIYPHATERLLSDLKPYVESGSWFRWEHEDGTGEIEDVYKRQVW